MGIVNRKVFAALVSMLLLTAFYGFEKHAESSSGEFTKYTSFSGSPGATEDEIKAIETIPPIDTAKIAEQREIGTYDYQSKLLRAPRSWLFSAIGLSLCVIVLIVVLLARSRGEGKRLEKLVEAQTSTLTTIFDAAPDLIFCKDLNSRYTKCNKSMEKYFGVREADIIGKSAGDALCLPAETAEQCVAMDKRIINEKQAVVFEEYMPSLDGKRMSFETIKAPLFQNGHVVGIVGMSRNITRRKAMEAEVRRASEAKSRFIANMSHEIRTPLNVIVGLTDLMLEENNPFKIKENLKKVSIAGNTLANLVSDVLDISKIEAEKLELAPVRYDVASLLNDIIILNIMRIESEDINFKIDINENLPQSLYGDDLRVKQVLNNLLSNAFKYTSKGTVTLGVNCEREDDENVRISAYVSDTGIGIRREGLEKLFSDYNQVDTRANRQIEGTGLGLSISKKLMELMDGEISVESEYGKGSTFTLKFRQGFVDDTVIGLEIANNLKELRYSDSKRARNSQFARVQLPYARVLVVDDNVTNLDVARGMMQAYGMQIDCATSGQQAIDAIRSEKVRYNAIFMDHMMPGMDGLETARIIREEIGTEYARTIPLIALTANAIVGNKEMFLSRGFQAFISKPIEITRLDAVIHQWVRDRDKENIFNSQPINVAGELFLERRKWDRRSGKRRNRGNEGHGTYGQTLPGTKNIPGLNASKGLARFSGDEKTYRQVLQSYVTNTRLILETVKEFNENNLDDYVIAVHGIKASSLGIGADSVGEMAEVLEKMAKAGNLDFLRKNHPAFLQAAGELTLVIENMIGKAAADKPKKDKPDAGILSRISIACKNYDIDELDAAMTGLEAFEYESDGGLAAWLRENVDRMNYEEITDKLFSLMDK
jgi:PAS domain S-box-containing protein